MSNDMTEKEVPPWQRMIERACEKANVNKLTIYDLQQVIRRSKATKCHIPRGLTQPHLVYALLELHNN